MSLGNAYHYRGELPNNQIFVASSKFKLKWNSSWKRYVYICVLFVKRLFTVNDLIRPHYSTLLQSQSQTYSCHPVYSLLLDTLSHRLRCLVIWLALANGIEYDIMEYNMMQAEMWKMLVSCCSSNVSPCKHVWISLRSRPWN